MKEKKRACSRASKVPKAQTREPLCHHGRGKEGGGGIEGGGVDVGAQLIYINC